MKLEEIKKLIDLAREQGLAELAIRKGDTSIRFAFAGVAGHETPATNAPAAAVTPRTTAPGSVIAAPLSGTFYRAPAPGEPPFVAVGDRVAAGDVVCIIESMKMMNRIKSEHAGEIAAVLLDDGQAIETGAGLFRIV